MRGLAEFIDPVDTPVTLRQLVGKHRWLQTVSDDQKTLRTMVDRHQGPRSRDIRLLTFNTYLMDVWSGIGGSAKPAVDDRAPRIGEAIENDFDIAMLNEIFEDNIKDKVIAGWPGTPPHLIEDARRRTGQSSGLVTISRWPLNHPLDNVHEFNSESGILQDGLASKGAMASWLPLDFDETRSTYLELYSTHLDASEAEVRRNQVAELAQFIERTHQSGNVVVLAGDFNIDSRTPEYANLRDSMRAIGLEDVWPARNGTAGFTSPSDNAATPDDLRICTVDRANPLYCDDFAGPPDNSTAVKRIDYIFLSEPTEAHAYSVDFTRPRRPRFERRAGAPKRDEIMFLSDHLGVSMTLVLSPR